MSVSGQARRIGNVRLLSAYTPIADGGPDYLHRRDGPQAVIPQYSGKRQLRIPIDLGFFTSLLPYDNAQE